MPEQRIPVGLCQCGCGEKTRIATYTCARDGVVRGQPRRYVYRHSGGSPQSVLKRLDRNTVLGPGGCWLWTGSRVPDGYGQISVDNVVRRAHRVAYELMVGPIPAGLVLDHLCRVPACVNPAHLEPVTPRENVRRGLHGRPRTHCPHGHEYTADNSYTCRNGSVACRTCRAAQTARYRARQRLAI